MRVHTKLGVLVLLVLNLHGQVYSGRIIGGHEAAAHSRPYMVLLEKHLHDGRTGHCGGFLLSEDFVMTAAHCHARSYTVVLGAHDVRRGNGVQRVSVDKEFPHKEYDANDYKNDLMLLKLSSKAKFGNNVKPIPLAGPGGGPLPTACFVCGWGRTNDSGFMSPVLREVNVTLVDSELCPNETAYCSESKSGPASGDSGGPLVCGDGKAYGVVSAMRPSPDGEMICTYVKIPANRKWIDGIMKNNKKF